MRQQIRFCHSVDGSRIAFAKAGQGPPIMRVGNWITHLELDWDSAVWRHWFEALADGRTLIRYDPRGCGLSDRTAGDLSLDAWVADLEAVADAAGLRRFPLIGLCQGGVVAVAYAARHPERVSRLVLYDSYLQGAYADSVEDEISSQARALSQMIVVGWGREAGAFREVFASLLMPDATREQIRWLAELERRSTSAMCAGRLWDAFNAFDIRHEAASLNVPTLVFHVRGDAMVPFEAGRLLASAIPQANFVPLESRNHILLPHEPAWALFRRELNTFLRVDALANPPSGSELPNLTTREWDVLDGIARGATNAEIATRLKISEKTVRNHITNVFSKLSVEHRAQAIVIARKAGLGCE